MIKLPFTRQCRQLDILSSMATMFTRLDGACEACVAAEVESVVRAPNASAPAHRHSVAAAMEAYRRRLAHAH